MDKDEVVATMALTSLEKEMRLRQIVSQPAYTYCGRAGVVRVIAGVLAIGGMIWMLIEKMMPAWGFMLFVLTMIGLLEAARQRERLDALIRLMELEKAKSTANQSSEPSVAPAPQVQR